MTESDILKVAFDRMETVNRIMRKIRIAQANLTVRAFADCNRYCKEDTGALKKSAVGNLKNGMLSWNTPYARKAYYTGKANTDVNPEAHLMWAHFAEKRHGKSWEAQVRKELYE